MRLLTVHDWESVTYYDMKKVLIIYRFLPHYRKEFYDKLKNNLESEGVQLDLIYGKSRNIDRLKNDEIDLEWAIFRRNLYMRFGKVELIWQPCLKDLKNYNLVIVEHANKLLLNYILIVIRLFSKTKLGLWGHGRNMQIPKNSLRNRFKNLFLRQCDVYFAYTKNVKEFLINHGLHEKKIINVQNAIDTQEIRKYYLSITVEEENAIRQELNLSDSITGIFCGGMYPEKRIDFILEAALRIKEEISGFSLIFIGSGVDAIKVKTASEKHSWIKYVGPKLGMERVKYFKAADFQMMPGLVGLGILDSFAFETPLVTTDYPFHSPEIEYLENGINGLITKNNINDYSSTIISLFQQEVIHVLIQGCRSSAEKYTIETMVDNFKGGILTHL